MAGNPIWASFRVDVSTLYCANDSMVDDLFNGTSGNATTLKGLNVGDLIK